jgi:hypothetical protein
MRVFLGIDDTDVLGHKPGTGRLARDLGAHLAGAGVRPAAVLRHQLLVDPRIPYTSHNSPACVILEIGLEQQVDGLFEAAAAWVAGRAATGSDPGICMALENAVDPAVVEWGLRAGGEVLARQAALALAAATGTRLRELGGTGDGIIGALAAVGLTRWGNAGRFLEMADGLRDFGDVVGAATLLERGITPVSATRNGEPVPPAARIRTGDWVRPRLIGGRPVLFVEPDDGGDWRCFDRKNDKHGHEGE